MRLSKHWIKRRNLDGSRASLSKSSCVAQALEERRMFAASGEYIATAIAPVLAHVGSPTSDSITLNQHFNDPVLPGTLVTFSTTQGNIQVGLSDAATPQTVANFLSYLNSGAYNDTIFHRSVDLNTGNNASPTEPGTIIQGGGYNISGGSLNHIPTNAPVADEYTKELYGDVSGTIAMAKTSEANSATSEFYFNVANNTELDTPTTDSTGTATSYTVFGQVLGQSSIATINTIAALPTDNVNTSLTSVPVAGITEAQLQAGDQITASNLVFVTTASAEPGTSYAVSSDNPSLVTPKVTNGVLSFTYGAGSGAATVSVTGKNLDGTSATTQVLVTVPNAATPSAGPVATAVTAPFTVTGSTGSFPVINGSTDSVAALNPASVAIVTPPSHGTAVVDTSNGYISYTPNSGYVGADTLTYTVADTNGTVSNSAVVTLDAVPTSVQVTVGAAGIRMLNFKQPDGTVGHLSVAGGTALVTFSNFQVTLSGPTNGMLNASGAGTTITNVVVTDKGTNAVLYVKATGPVTLGSVSDKLHLSINAPQATLSGDITTGSSEYIYAAALVNANLSLGLSPVRPVLLIPSVANSNVSSQTEFHNILSKQWVSTDGGTYTLSAPGIEFMNVTGAFDEAMQLSSTGYGIFFVKVGQPGALWNLAGSIFQAQIGSPKSGWSISSNGLVQRLNIQGNLTNSISAAAIETMAVQGTTSGATIQTSATYNKRAVQIGTIAFKGAVTNTVVYAAGNIGSISAPSFVNSRIYAGVNLTVAQNGAVAASASDLSATAKINSVSIKTTAAGFSGSEISADVIGSLNLGKVITNANSLPEAVSAHTIGAVAATLSPGGVIKAGPGQLKTAATLAAYIAAKKLALGNFSIKLF